MKATITKYILCATALLLPLLIHTQAHAQYGSTRNGNMSVSYTDIEFEKHPLKFDLSRSYNSKSAYKSWFGMGWANYYETSLLVIPGGGIVVFNYGDGRWDVHGPKIWNKQDIAVNINKLVAFAQSELHVETTEEIADLQTELKEDETKRIRNWRKYVAKHPSEMLSLKVGTKLVDLDYGISQVEVLADGYRRTKNDGLVELFDSKGRLYKVSDAAGNELLLHYNNEQHPYRISDNLGNKIELQFEAGRLRVAEATYADGTKRKSLYEYDKLNENLIASTDTGGNHYRHEWDNNSNMTAIKYTDGREARMTYDPETQFVTSIKRKNGERFTYAYPQISDDEYGTDYVSYDSTGALKSKISHWYVYKTTDIGKRWLYKWVTVMNNDSVSYTNSEKHERADTVRVNNGVYYTFSYNNRNELQQIFKNGATYLSFSVKDGKLEKIVSAKTTYTPVYKEDMVEKLIAEDKTEVPMPLKDLNEDPKGYKADVAGFLSSLRYTSHWYEMHAGG